MWSVTQGEIEDTKQQLSTTREEASFSNLVLDPIVQGFMASPVAQLGGYLESASFTKGNIPGNEANAQYGLDGTPAAFKDDELVTEERAKYVQRRYLDSQYNQAKIREVEEDFGGVISGVTNFGGNLVGAMADPINLALGFGVGAIATKMGMNMAVSVARSSVESLSRRQVQKIMAKTFAGALAENFVGAAVTEYTFGKLQEYGDNVEVSTQDRVFGIMAGTLLGGVIQAGTGYAAISKKMFRGADARATKFSEEYGALSENVLIDTAVHNMAAEQANVKPNPDFIKSKVDLELFGTRVDQVPYEFQDMIFGLTDAKFYRAASSDGISSINNMGVILSDNYNMVHNSVARHGVNESSAVVQHFEIGKMKIMNKATYDVDKINLSKTIENDVKFFKDKYGIPAEKVEPFSDAIRHITNTAENIEDFRAMLHQVATDLELDIDTDTLLKNNLKDMRYDGIHAIGHADGVNNHNQLIIFDEGNAKANVIESSPIKPFDAVKETDIARKLKDMELAEMQRFRDPTESTAYSKDADIEIAKIMEDGVDTPDKVVVDLDEELTALGLATQDAEGNLNNIGKILEAVRANDDVSIVKALSACVYTGKNK